MPIVLYMKIWNSYYSRIFLGYLSRFYWDERCVYTNNLFVGSMNTCEEMYVSHGTTTDRGIFDMVTQNDVLRPVH